MPWVKALVSGPVSFYVLRFLLGAFEAGFFPGIILYLTFWYPGARRGKAIATFMTGATLAYLIAGPTSGAILKYMDGLGGWHGWQWMFIVQGVPASILGLVAFFYLKDQPEQAGWLTAGEKTALRNHLDNDVHVVAGASHGSLLGLIRDPKVYTLSVVYFLVLGATYVMVFWMPTLVRSWGVADLFVIGLLTAIPSVCAAVAMVLIGRSSDRHVERRWHFVFCTVLAFTGAVQIVQQPQILAALNPMEAARFLRGQGWHVFVALGAIAMMLSIDAKFWGVVVMGGAVIILFFLPWLDHSPVKSIRYRPDWHKYLYGVFVIIFLILGYLGVQPPSPIGERVSQVGTLFYFGFFLLMPWWSRIGKTKPVPDRVTYVAH